MSASWLTDVLGPSRPRTVSVTRNNMPSSTPVQSPTGSNTPFALDGLLQRLQGSYDESNKAGLDQYKNLMASVGGVNQRVLGAGGLYDQAGAGLTTMGNTARGRIAQGATRAKAESSQDLVSRGLSNTTIGASMNRGIDSDAEFANQGVDEQINNARSGLAISRAGTEGDLGRLTADSILSKRNEGPDQQLYAQLIAQLGRSGGLGSFSSGGGSSGASVPATGSSPKPQQPQGGGNYAGVGGVTTVTGQGNGDKLTKVSLPINDDMLMGTNMKEQYGGLIVDKNTGQPVARRSYMKA